jgi:hypothetical protein
MLGLQEPKGCLTGKLGIPSLGQNRENDWDPSLLYLGVWGRCRPRGQVHKNQNAQKSFTARFRVFKCFFVNFSVFMWFHSCFMYFACFCCFLEKSSCF